MTDADGDLTELDRAVRLYGPRMVYPDGTITDRRSGAILWRPGDDPSNKPQDAAASQTQASPGAPSSKQSDSPLLPLNFELATGKYLLTPTTASGLRREQDRFLSQLVPLAPGYPMWVQHFERDEWHTWKDCWTAGCRTWPVWARTVLPNEVVFETDRVAGDGSDKAASYALNVPAAKKIVSAIALMVGKGDRRTFAAFVSGQKSIHVLLYLKMPDGTSPRRARKLREIVWEHVIRLAGLEPNDFDKANVGWEKRRMLHAWGDLARQFPYTWAGFSVPTERRRELRMPPAPRAWDPLIVPEIREAFEARHELDVEPEPWSPPSGAAKLGLDDDPYLLELAEPPEGDHNRALGAIAATLKGRFYTVDQAIAWVLAHWRPRGCNDPEHTEPARVAAHVRRVYRSSYVRRARWSPPAFVAPADGSAPVLLPGMAKGPRREYCGDRRFRAHRRGGTRHVMPYRASCGDDLCPVDYARVSHGAAIRIVEDLAALLGAPESAALRDAALDEFDPDGSKHGRGRQVRSRRPADRFGLAETWRIRPVRLVVTPPAATRVLSTDGFRELRRACTEAARSQGFCVARVMLHDRKGTPDVRRLCTDRWHAEMLGAFTDGFMKAEGDSYTDPVTGYTFSYSPITGPLLQVVRSLRMTAARVTDSLDDANFALALGDNQESGADEGEGGVRGESKVRVRVEAVSACHDLCPTPDRHPARPEPARWCTLCPVDDAWVGRRDWGRCTYVGSKKPPDKPVEVDREAWVLDWRAETPGWFSSPVRTRHGVSVGSGFDQAMAEEGFGSPAGRYPDPPRDGSREEYG